MASSYFSMGSSFNVIMILQIGKCRKMEMELRKECYEVGALLYCPALNAKLADAVMMNRFGKQYSLAICLEDTIGDESVEKAEKQLLETLTKITDATTKKGKKEFFLPKIFIRVREPEQLQRIYGMLKDQMEVIYGFIFPKYTISNAPLYNKMIVQMNKAQQRKIYMMPILESADIVDYACRRSILLNIKKMIDDVKEYVLNVRVGGNDFCNEFAARRHYDESIYDIIPIANLLSDILTVFSREYVVSGPVWEFFSSDNNEWKDGLRKECELDKLNGFVGKTVIHPKQIKVVNEALMVSKKDYEDAKLILGFDAKKGLLVGKSNGGERMNEARTHKNWASKIMILAEIFGVN